MVNRFRGESVVRVGDVEYRLKTGTAVLVDLERRSGMPLGAVLKQMSDGDMSVANLAHALHAGLQRYHKAQFPTLDEVCDLIDEMGIKEAGECLAKLIQASFAGAASVLNPDGKDGVKDPLASGTGENSTSAPGPSA